MSVKLLENLSNSGKLLENLYILASREAQRLKTVISFRALIFETLGNPVYSRWESPAFLRHSGTQYSEWESPSGI